MFFEYADWPDSLTQMAAYHPLQVIELDAAPKGDADITAALPDGVDLSPLTESDIPLFFVKLGPKSWRNRRSRAPVFNAPDLAAALNARLARPTPQQTLLARYILKEGAPLRLYVYEWKDVTALSEFRVQASEGDVWVSSAKERFGARPDFDALLTMAQQAFDACAAEVPALEALQIDIGFGRFDPAAPPSLRLIEVNPTEADAAALLSA
ncbi:hypothetical protein IV417_10695 [Alphaproteobacteria bacterium KMM 3653]|uniref:Uncharacterized protein n=1 Tax=Harenicola maris TaxID=2841044 RepID=A0AAP2CNU4_9RHOB|nr:hypothetical protein [Harenicola maris]